MSEKIELLKLLKEKRIRECREDFWEFCKELSPEIKINNKNIKIYRDDIKYLKELAKTLQDLLEGKIYKNKEEVLGLCISLPPRLGKSLTVEFFISWAIGNHQNKKFAYISYTQDLVNKFSRNIKNNIEEEPDNNLLKITYKDIFPNLKIKKDNKATKNWSLSGNKDTLSTGSFRTPITGSGFNGLIIVDDPIKNSEEAMNEKALEDKWNIFTDTIISRLETGGKMIVIQTRWSKLDIVGKLKESEWTNKFKYIELEAMKKEKNKIKMLNNDLLSFSDYKNKKSMINPRIFNANFHQQLTADEGRLYREILFWDKLPSNNPKDYKIVATLDPSADGKDYTAIVVGYLFKKSSKIYIKDIYYKNDNIVNIQNSIVDFLVRNQVQEITIESNGAFIVLTDNIKKKIIKRGNNCIVKSFKQTKNKENRILSFSELVQKNIIWPNNLKGSEPYEHFKNFKDIIKNNKNDDLEDCITLLYQKYIHSNSNNITNFSRRYFV